MQHRPKMQYRPAFVDLHSFGEPLLDSARSETMHRRMFLFTRNAFWVGCSDVVLKHLAAAPIRDFEPFFDQEGAKVRLFKG